MIDPTNPIDMPVFFPFGRPGAFLADKPRSTEDMMRKLYGDEVEFLEIPQSVNYTEFAAPVDDLVEELFPPDIPTLQPVIPVPTASDTYDPQYREAKRKMVADIRTYFNQRKINAAIREAEIKTGLPMNSTIFSTGPDSSSLPSPPSIERLME